MRDLKNKIYTFSVKNEDGTGLIEITRNSNWEGLKLSEQLNMFKTLLLQESWGEESVRCIRILDQDDLDVLYPGKPSVLEEYEE